MNRDTPVSQAAEALFLTQREELARVLGLHTVDLLIDRGITEIGEAFPALAARHRAAPGDRWAASSWAAHGARGA